MKSFITIVIAVLMSACSSVSYTTQQDESSYLQLEGNYQDVQVQLGEDSFTISETTESFELNGNMVVKLEVESGKHELIVSKDNQVVVRKFVFLSEGETFAVAIP